MKKIIFSQGLLYLALLVGVAATLFGLAQMQWPQDLPWAGMTSLIRYASFLLVASFLVGAGARWLRLSPIPLICFLLPVASLATGTLWPLLATICFALSSWVLGKWLLTRFDVSAGDVLSVPFLVGAGVYGTGVGLLAHWPLAYPGVFGVGLALPLIFGSRQAFEIISESLRWLRTERQSRHQLDPLGIAVGALALFHFTIALMPEVSFDALALHLLVPGHLALRHEWGFDPSLYALALVPMLGDWLFSIGYVLAGETGARLINLGFTFLLAWQAREVVIWAGGDEKGAKWAALLFLAAPLTLTETASLHVEAVWGAFLVGGSVAVFRLVSAPRTQEAKLAGLLLGLAASAKAVTLSYLPALAIPLIVCWRVWTARSHQKAFVIGAILFLVAGVTPYLTAWLIAGNPVHPFFNGFFKSAFYPAVNFDNTLFKAGLAWDTLYKVTFQSAKYLEATNGAAGFQLLLLLPATLLYFLLAKRTRALLLFAVAIIAIAVVFHSQSYLRYVFPALLLLTALIGVGLSNSSDGDVRPARAFLLVAVMSLGLNGLFHTAATWTYRDMPFSILLSKPDRDRDLEIRMPIRRAVEMVNLINPGQFPVAFLSQPFAAGLSADALYPNWYNHKFQQSIESVKTPEQFGQLLGQYGANLIVLDSSWSTDEKRKPVIASTKLIAEFGTVSVRELDSRFRHTRELLVNPELEGGDGWSRMPGIRPEESNGTFVVTVDAPAAQSLPVMPGRTYLNTVRSRCKAENAQGRVQVNWLDREGRLISASIQPFDCSEAWGDHRQQVMAPKSAAIAVVYATAHGNLAIEIDSVSFKGD